MRPLVWSTFPLSVHTDLQRHLMESLTLFLLCLADGFPRASHANLMYLTFRQSSLLYFDLSMVYLWLNAWPRSSMRSSKNNVSRRGSKYTIVSIESSFKMMAWQVWRKRRELAPYLRACLSISSLTSGGWPRAKRKTSAFRSMKFTIKYFFLQLCNKPSNSHQDEITSRYVMFLPLPVNASRLRLFREAFFLTPLYFASFFAASFFEVKPKTSCIISMALMQSPLVRKTWPARWLVRWLCAYPMGFDGFFC